MKTNKSKLPSTVFYKHTCPPQSHNRAPYGSLYLYQPDPHERVTYIQCNKDPDEPTWLTVSEFFMDVFGPCLKDQEFTELCLEMYGKRCLEDNFYSNLEKLL